MHKVFFSQLLLRRKLVIFSEVMLVFWLWRNQHHQRQTKIVVTCLNFITTRPCSNLCGANGYPTLPLSQLQTAKPNLPGFYLSEN